MSYCEFFEILKMWRGNWISAEDVRNVIWMYGNTFWRSLHPIVAEEDLDTCLEVAVDAAKKAGQVGSYLCAFSLPNCFIFGQVFECSFCKVCLCGSILMWIIAQFCRSSSTVSTTQKLLSTRGWWASLSLNWSDVQILFLLWITRWPLTAVNNFVGFQLHNITQFSRKISAEVTVNSN